MKKTLFLLSVITLFAGCDKFNDVDQPSYSGNQNANLLTSIYAGVADDDTRTYLENDTDILWQNGDALSLFYSNCRNVKFEYNGESGAKIAKFDLVYNTGILNDQSLKTLNTHALYPYDQDATTEYEEATGAFNISTTIPTRQSYTPNSFGRGANIMVAASQNSVDELNNDPLIFRNACGYLTIKLYGEGVKVRSIRITACGGEKIAGGAIIKTTAEEAPVVKMGSNGSTIVTLDCGTDGVALGADKDLPTEFWFALPPTTIAKGIQLEVTDTNGNIFKKKTEKQIVIERNKIQPMAALKFEQNMPNDNQIWYIRRSDSKEPINFTESESTNPFDATITHHYFDETYKCFVIKFDAPVKEIYDLAFGYSDIKSISLPQSLTTIGHLAFYRTSLEGITIPGSVTYLGKKNFAHSDYFRSITFEPSPTKTPLRVEYYDNTPYEEGAFSRLTLSYVNINRELIHVKNNEPLTPSGSDEGMFANYTYGKSSEDEKTPLTVIIGEQVTELDDYMFYYRYIKELTISGDIKKIGNYTFMKCTTLPEITIPASVEHIGYDAFYDCSSLKSVKIEDSDTPLKIGYTYEGSDEWGPFYDSPLTYIYFGRDIIQVDDDDEVSPADNWEEGVFTNCGYKNDNLTVSLNIGPKVTTITDYMFSTLRVRSVYLYPAIQAIGKFAFNECEIFEGLSCNHTTPPTLGANAFEECEAMWYIRIPESAMNNFKSADGWKAFDRDNKFGKNFYYKQ